MCGRSQLGMWTRCLDASPGPDPAKSSVPRAIRVATWAHPLDPQWKWRRPLGCGWGGRARLEAAAYLRQEGLG